MRPTPTHLIDSGSSLFDRPLLRALAACGHPVVLLGPERDRRLASVLAPGLRVLGAASAPAWSVRSGALALRRLIDGLPDASIDLFAWGGRTWDVAVRSGIGGCVEVPSHLWVAPPHEPASPAIDEERRRLRESIGLSADEKLVVGFGARASVDAVRLVRLSGVLSHAGNAIMVTVPTGARGLDQSRTAVARHVPPWPVYFESDDAMDLTSVADVAVSLPSAEGDEISAVIESKAQAFRCLGVPVVLGSLYLDRRSDLRTSRMVRDALRTGLESAVEPAQNLDTWRSEVESLSAAAVTA